ncbi:MAG: hypothetical protein ACM3S1_02345 [Hyphomicrobiales bacterium]
MRTSAGSRRNTRPKIEEQQARLEDIDFEGGDPADVRDELLGVLNDVRDEREDIIASFQDLGSPGIENGGAVKDAFNDNFEENQAALDDLIDAVEGLDPKSGDFQQDLVNALTGLDNGKSLRDYLEDAAADNGAVNDIIAAIDADPDCADILFEDDPAGAETPAATATRQAGTTPQTNSDNEQWVSGFCSAFGSYMTDLTALGEDMQSANIANIDEAKQAIVGVFEDARDRSEDLQGDLEALGAPHIADGEKFQELMESAAGELVSIFDGAVTDARALPTDDVNAFVADVDDLTTRFREAFDELGTTFDQATQYDISELNRLFAEVPECADLG